jgi:hypothetical protein
MEEFIRGLRERVYESCAGVNEITLVLRRFIVLRQIDIQMPQVVTRLGRGSTVVHQFPVRRLLKRQFPSGETSGQELPFQALAEKRKRKMGCAFCGSSDLIRMLPRTTGNVSSPNDDKNYNDDVNTPYPTSSTTTRVDIRYCCSLRSPVTRALSALVNPKDQG